jgi:hypothetical protein
MVGVALLMVFTFIGYSLKSGGEMGMDLLITILISSFTALMLWFLIKAKGAENNLDKWIVAEIIALVVYVGVMVYTTLFGGIMHFFVVNENKENIKEYANSDIQKLENMFVQYEEFERNAVATTRQGLTNATQRNQYKTDSLKTFLTEHNIDASHVEVFADDQMSKVLGTNYEQTRERLNNLRNEVTACVEGWSILRVGSMAKNIEECAIKFQDVLTELSSRTDLPIIEYDRTQRKYSIVVADQSAEFKVEGGIESLQFKQAITQADGFSIVAIVVAILIHTLILFNYIMAYRTRTIRVGKDTEEDGGRILY